MGRQLQEVVTSMQRPRHRAGKLAGEPVCPNWLTGRGKKLWTRKLEIYARRKQSVAGLEEALAQYCSLEARAIEDYYRIKKVPPAGMLGAIIKYQIQFYDTPASQVIKGLAPEPQSENPFADRGRPPEE